MGSALSAPLRPENYISLARSAPKRHILRNFDGLIKSGKMLIVLGRPGSGYSTFLKIVCGELHRLLVHKESVIHYNGIPMERMHKQFKGECVYNQEVDKHFPHLTAGQTLEFTAAARTPSSRPSGCKVRWLLHRTELTYNAS
jgi:ATP-binding cassette, subfamily G (WHITE), member 2, PDR